MFLDDTNQAEQYTANDICHRNLFPQMDLTDLEANDLKILSVDAAKDL